MLKVEEWVAIRELARKGVSISEISRITGRDRKTVQNVLWQEAPKVKRELSKPKASKLDPFRDYLMQRVDQGCLNATVLLEEIAQLGYGGKVSILREMLTPIRRELVRKREATERFETGPGKQAQVDWGDFGKIWDSRQEHWRKLQAFVYTLGYSRSQYLEFVISCDMEHFLACHLGAFRALGIPQTILYDNLKTGILGRNRDGTPIFPGRFLDFALYYGFSPKYCQPYRPRTKGKVERGIGYIRQNFWVRVANEVAAGRVELEGLNERAKQWVETVANVRVHGTHGEVVLKRFREEEEALGRLEGSPCYNTDYRSVRRVGRDGRLSYHGQVYQVGLKHALSEVQVDESLKGEVKVWEEEGQLLRAERVSQVGRGVGWERLRGEDSEGACGPSDLGQLIRVREPEVETRDLEVYEEVARAAGIS